MNATKYQIFLKTVECGSFTKAAADLNFSQSGISHAINSLEEELGVTLLSRNRGGVTLTGDGRALLPQIQQLCTEYHRLAQQAADLRGMDAGLVKVASFSSVSAQWLPMILKAFSKQYPAIEFEIQTCDFYDQIEELIITGQADIIKLAMVRVHRRLAAEGLEARLIMQVHDELIVECPEAEASRVEQLLQQEMQGVAELSVPLLAEAHTGHNWLAAKG